MPSSSSDTTPSGDARASAGRGAKHPAKHTRTALHALAWEALGLLLVVAFLVGVVLLLLAWISARGESLEAEMQKAEAAAPEERLPVVVSPLKPQKVTDRIRLPGLLEPWSRAVVSAEVGGRVVERHVEDGDVVKKGDLLVQLDRREYAINLAKAEAALTLAQQTYERTKKLHAKKVKTQAELDAAQRELLEARALVDGMKLNIEHTTILSPLNGIVDDVYPEEGELLSRGDPVAKVLEIGRMKVDIGIPERDVTALRDLETSEVSVSAVAPGFSVTGRRVFLSYEPVENSLVYRLRLEIPNPKHLLRPHMLAEADLIKTVYPDAIRVPLFAIVPRGKKHLAFVAEPDSLSGGKEASLIGRRAVIREREVTLGVMQERYVQVLSGLEADDLLVVLGQRNVADGSKVVIRQAVEDIRELLR